MAMTILPSSLSMRKPPPPALSSIRFLSNGVQFSIRVKLPIRNLDFRESNLTIRMGGGPRTYPGGVSKWQWKRMQAKKAKQLLKARLCRERQMYEMRKRTELKAAISELERPWEVVEKAPNLFSVKADEQLKVLADRFQKPGGFDMWSERDGPQILRPYDGLPSARFFPKGVVHSVKPYGVIANTAESSSTVYSSSDEDELQFNDWIARGKGGSRRVRRSSSHRGRLLSDDERVHETKDLTRNRETKGSSYATLSNSGVSRRRDFENRDETEDKRCLEDRGYRDFISRRKAPNSNLMNLGIPRGVNNESNAARPKKFSGKNGDMDSNGGTVSSAYGRARNSHGRRHSSESSNGSNMNAMATGIVGRRKIKSNGTENVDGYGFVVGRRSVQDKNSQDNDTYRRRRIFNWGEDDNFGNSH